MSQDLEMELVFMMTLSHLNEGGSTGGTVSGEAITTGSGAISCLMRTVKWSFPTFTRTVSIAIAEGLVIR